MRIHNAHGYKFPDNLYSGADAAIPGTYLFRNATGATTMATYVDADGWCRIRATRSSAGNVYPMAYSNFKLYAPLIATSNVFVGFRVKNTTGTYPNIVMGFINDGIANILTVFANTDLPSLAVNVEYYCEYQLDVVNKLINRWVNGVALSAITMPTWIINLCVAGNTTALYEEFGHYANQSIAANAVTEWCIKDRVFYEYDLYEPPLTLGPMTVVELPVLSDAGTGFTASTGSVVSALATSPNGTGSLNAPVISGPTGASTLATKFDSNGLAANAKVRGVHMQMWASSSPDPAGTYTRSLSVAGVKVDEVAGVAFSLTPSLVTNVGRAPLQPNGKRWDKTALSSLQFNLATAA